MRIRIIFLFSILLLTFNNIAAQDKAIIAFGNEKGIVYDMCFSKGGTMLVVPENNSINIYDVETQKILYKLDGGHTNQILSVDISPDSSLIVSGGKDSLLILWDMKTQKVIRKLDYHNGVITSVKFSPYQKRIASGSSDNKVVLYDFDLNNIIYNFTDHTADVSSIAFNSYGNILASGSEDKSIILWDTGKGELLRKLTSHKKFIRNVSFSDDDTRLISCDDNSRIIIWNMENIEKIKVVKNTKQGSNWLLSTSFHSNDKAYASGGIDGKLRVVTHFGNETYKIQKPIHKILFKPNEGSKMKVAVATRGKGVLLIDTSKLKSL